MVPPALMVMRNVHMVETVETVGEGAMLLVVLLHMAQMAVTVAILQRPGDTVDRVGKVVPRKLGQEATVEMAAMGTARLGLEGKAATVEMVESVTVAKVEMVEMAESQRALAVLLVRSVLQIRD